MSLKRGKNSKETPESNIGEDEKFLEKENPSEVLFPSTRIKNATFLWVFETLKKANSSKLTVDSLGKISPLFEAKELFAELKSKWEEQSRGGKKNPLFNAIVISNIRPILELFFFGILKAVLNTSFIFLFRQVLVSFEENGSPKFSFQQTLILFLAVYFIKIFVDKRNLFLTDLLGVKIKTQLNALIYNKLFRMKLSNKSDCNEGGFVNFIETDSETFGNFLSQAPVSFVIPFQLAFYFIYLFKYFGPYFLVGLVGFLLIMALLSWIQKIIMGYEKKRYAAKDERIKAINEMINNIKVIKVNSWENAFLNRIQKKREKEISFYKKGSFFSALTNILYWSCEMVLSILSISTYIIFENEMSMSNILTSMYIFDSFSDPMLKIPVVLNNYFISMISLKRIENFLFEEETDTSQIELVDEAENAIEISGCDFSAGSKVLLQNIELKVKKRESVGIIGEIGSGKTCLLSAILNNLTATPKNSNKIRLSGSIGYISQSPWILNDTFRSNILFFKDYDEKKYKAVLDLCELNQDLRLFNDGDLTIIGEKGANLSGGQRARIAIARALYNEADIYLFDDCLSSLDANVGMKILQKAILEHLKEKTVLFITHSLQYLKFFDRVIYMNAGRIEWSGTPNEYLQKHTGVQSENKDTQKSQEQPSKENLNEQEEKEKQSKSQKEKKQPVKTENKSKSILKSLVVFYAYAGGLSYLLSKVFFNVSMHIVDYTSDYYLTYWTSKENLTKRENIQNLIKYNLISFITIIIVCFRAREMIRGIIRYNLKMHNEMLDKLVHGSLSLFHDITPKGEILSKINRDLDISTGLNNFLNGTLYIIFQLIICFLVCVYYNKFFLFLIPLIILTQLGVVKFYLPGTKDLSKIEGTSREPIISVFTETIPGISLIKTRNCEKKFIEKFYTKLNNYFKVRLFQNGVLNWFQQTLDVISFALLVSLLSFCALYKGFITPQVIGLLLTYSFKFVGDLLNGMNRFTSLERLATAVERCEMLTKIPQEETKEEVSVPKSFIEKGKIVLSNFSARYRPDTPLVLRDINISINPGEKIGVVGRTGSGKSTLCLSLLRILEPETGNVLIDDVDIGKISLETLRKNITVISQEPTLFEGTLRENIDPNKSYHDNEILQTFINCRLDDFFEKGLDFFILENGANLSGGERQLICVVRAILKKSKLVLMDEPTSSIDYKTENLIQKFMQKIFEESTVITIAHRIKTIIDYDRILVLNEGRVAEFDTPKKLLENRESLFSELYKESSI